MKVVFITPVTPYKENMGGPSGHPYHLMIERPEGIEIVIYSFNDNHLSSSQIEKIEQELNVTIKIVKRQRWIDMTLKYHLLFIRLCLKYPIIYYYKLPLKEINEIASLKPDGIWGYCEGMNSIMSQFKNIPKVLTPPDSVSLYYYRMLGYNYVFSNWKLYWRYVFMYHKYLKMESSYSTDTKYHMVGKDDMRFLQKVNPNINVFFLRHPHYNVNSLSSTLPRREGAFHQPKIKLLIAGQYNHYMKQDGDLLIKSLTPAPSPKEKGIEDFLQKHYSFTFLGKGWEKHVETLRSAGYEVEHIKFAPDYIEEICKHDIQITPISIGTGTKGKVLDALANGLLVIGTPYALENIAVKHGESCIEYRQPQEVIEVLKDIPNNIHKYEMMAAEGQRQVLTQHSRKKISKELFSQFI